MGKLENDAKERIFDQLIIYACKKESERIGAELSSLQTSTIDGPSPEFDQKMFKLFEREEKRLRRGSRMSFYSKIAASIIIAITVLSVAFYGADAVRVKFLNTIITMKEDHLQITFQPTAEDNENDYSQISNNKVDAFLPSYIPEGFSIAEAEKSASNHLIILTDANNNRITINQTLISSGTTIGLDNEGATETRVELGGLDITLLEKRNIITGDIDYTLFWQDSGYFFFIISNIDKDELLQMASSMSTAPLH